MVADRGSTVDASDEELEILGLSEQHTREIRGILKFVNDASLREVERDIKIGELEVELSNLNKKNQELMINLENFQSDYAQSRQFNEEEQEEIRKVEKEKGELIEEIKVERDKLWEIYNEKESQISRMKNLITDGLKDPNSKISLKDRIKLLFKIEGLTVGAIILAIVMTFTTLGLTISNSLKGSTPPSPPSPTPTPPSPEPGIPNKVKEGLKKFAEWLKELAKKSLSALPGIIDSIVSFIFKSAGAVVGFLAEHLIILGFIIVSSIVYGMMSGVSYIKK